MGREESCGKHKVTDSLDSALFDGEFCFYTYFKFHFCSFQNLIPNITGWYHVYWSTVNNPNGCFYGTDPTWNGGSSGGDSGCQYYDTINFNAASSNNIYSNSSTVQPPSIYTLIIIKV